MKQLAVNGRKQELTKVLLLGILAGGLAIPGRALAADLTVTADQTGPVYAATGDGVESNNLTIGSVTLATTITGSAYGGMGTSGGSYSDSNTVTLNNGTVTENLYGTYDPDIATYSTVTIHDGTVQGNVYGGYAQSGTANNNHVYVGTDASNTGDISIGGSVYGGYSEQGDVGSNSVEIDRGTVKGNVYGSYGAGGSGSSVTLGTEGSTIGPSIGGSLYGSYGTSGWAYANGLTINSGEVKGTVYGSWGSLATQNTLTVNGGTIDQGIYGGYSSGIAENNTITIKGGTITGDIYGGYSTEGETNSNTINLYGGTLTDASLYGGVGATGRGNNTLNVYTLGNSVVNLGAFQNLNFYVPATAATTANATMLTVTGKADVTGSTISAGVENIDAFTTNQVITLLTDSNGIIGLDGVTFGTLTDAGFAQTGFYLSKTTDNHAVTLTIGTKTDDSGSGSGDSGSGSGSDSGNSGSSDSGDVTPVAGDAVEITTGGTTASYGDYQTSYLTSAADNVVTVKSGTYTSSIYGSYGGDGGTSNKVSIGAVGTDGPSITGDVLGDSGTGTTYFNEVTVNSGTINGTVYGAKSNTATYNTITVNGGTITGGIYGAYSTSDANGAINSNTLNLLGGKVSGAIYGGYSENGSLGDNNINLKGTDVSGASLYGAAGTGSGMDTNTLNVYTLGNSVVNLGGFQNINFYIPDTAKSTENATMLTVTDTADITNTAIKAGIEDLTGYADGTVITLLTDANGLTGLTSAMVGTITDAGFAQAGFYLTKSRDGKAIVLTIGEKPTDYVTIVTNGNTASYPDYQTDYLSSQQQNSVTLTGGTFAGDIYGAKATSGDTGDNKVTITAGTVQASVYGASGGTGGGSNIVTLGTSGTDGPTITGNVYAYDGTGVSSFDAVSVASGSVGGTIYGAKTDTATYNTVTVSGGSVGNIYGAYSSNSNGGVVDNNTVTLSGGTVTGDVYGAYGVSASVGSNTVNLQGSTVKGSVYAGSSESGSASGNTINLYSTDVSGASLYGGGGTGSEFTNNTLNVYTLGNSVANIGNFQNINFYIPDTAKTTADATMLTVTGTADITNTAIKAGIADLTGYTEGTVITLLTDDNGLTGLKSAAVGTLTDSGFAQTGYYLTKSKDGNSIILTIGTKPTDYVSIVTNGLTSAYPDYDTEYLANTKGNTVTITGSTFATNLYGAYASGVETSDNTVAVSAGTVDASVYGAFGGSSGTNNTVTLGAAGTDGPTITGDLYAYDGTGITSGNTVTVSSGSVGGAVYGGQAATVTQSTIAVNGGSITNGIYGGYSTSGGSVDENVINLNAGTVSGNIYGGYSENGSVGSNVINLYSTDVSGASLYGGYGGSVDNNTLNVYTVGNTVQNLGGFQNLNFYVPATAVKGDTMLTITGSADVTDAAIQAGISDLTQLTDGDVITLLTDAQGITGLKSAALGTLTDAGFATTSFYLSKDAGGTAVYLTLGTDPNGPLPGDDVTITTHGLTASYGDFKKSYLYDTGENQVTVTGGSLGDVYGAYSDSEAVNNNTVTIAAGTLNGSVTGAYGRRASGNLVTLGADGTAGPAITGEVLGASVSRTAYNNAVTVNSGTIAGTVYGAKGRAATFNTVTVNGGTLTKGIYGGYSDSDDYGTINNNTLNLLGGTVSGVIYGGYTENGSVEGNVINLYSTDVSGASLYGGSGSSVSNNTLNVYTVGNTVQNLGSFQNINFYVPAATAAGSTMLTVTGTADVTDSVISAAVANINDYTGTTLINLLTADTLKGLDSVTFGNLVDAGFATSGFTLMRGADGKSVLLTIGTAANVEITSQTDSKTQKYDTFQTDYLGDTSGNTVSVTGGDIETTVYGGYNDSTNGLSVVEAVSHNSVTVSGGTVGGVSGGYTTSGSITGNQVALTTGTTSDGTITTSTVTGNVYGAQTESGNVGTTSGGNSVTLAAGTVSGSVYGAATASGTATGNSVTLKAATDTTGNTTTATVSGSVYGGQSTSGDVGTADGGNSVTVEAGTVSGSVYGGATTDGSAIGNHVVINGGTLGTTTTGTTTLHGLRLLALAQTGTTSTTSLYGGYTTQGLASENTVTVNQGTVTGSVYGGYTDSGDATQNVVTLKGGTVSGTVYGGYTNNGTASGNTVNVYGGDLTAASLNGGYGVTAAAAETGVSLLAVTAAEAATAESLSSSDNTLNVYTTGNTVAGLSNFQNLNFYIPADAAANATLLTVTGTADITGASVKAGIADATTLPEGAEITLLTDSNGITGVDTAAYGLLTDAGFAQRNLSLEYTADSITAILGGQRINGSTDNGNSSQPAGPHLNAQTKSLVETQEAALGMLNNAGDFMVNQSLLAGQNQDGSGEYQLFAAMGASSLRYETGSYVKNHGMNAELGFARQLKSGQHTALIMPFVEYGNGNYTSHLDDGTRGDGQNTYYGAGLLARQENANGLYTEGSFRVGHTQGDYSGVIAGYRASYDLDHTYTAAHMGTGREFQLTDKDSLDVYARFFYTHMNSAETHLHSSLGSAPYEFDSVNSYRSRIGTRWTRNYGSSQSLYAGLAWDYEFGSSARAAYHDMHTLSPDVKGSSGMVELGWISKASKENPWSADVRVTQWIGKQKGTQFSVGAQYHF